MAVTVQQVVDAFWLYYENLHSRDFRKTYNLNEWSEQELHPLVRSFLLGYFGAVAPEVLSALPGAKTRYGRIDYVVDNVAIELAVRRPHASKSTLAQVTNATEVKKLLKWDGLALLVLLDFSSKPFTDDDLQEYRYWPSLGQGNHKVTAFNVAYFYREDGECRLIKKNIRI